MARSTIEVIRKSLGYLQPEELRAALRVIERYWSMYWIEEDEARSWEREIKEKIGLASGDRTDTSH
jgi:hypothetical protein